MPGLLHLGCSGWKCWAALLRLLDAVQRDNLSGLHVQGGLGRGRQPGRCPVLLAAPRLFLRETDECRHHRQHHPRCHRHRRD